MLNVIEVLCKGVVKDFKHFLLQLLLLLISTGLYAYYGFSMIVKATGAKNASSLKTILEKRSFAKGYFTAISW